MPNWCSNGLTLTHKDPAMITRAHEAMSRGEFLQEFIPCPKELLETTAQFGANDEEKANRERLGYSSWYDFNIANWGTKWDISDASVEVQDANTLTASFDTAWAPPIAAYGRLEAMGFVVEAFYYEPGMAFVGKYEDGDDDCYEYGGYTSDTVRDVIGAELDDYFGISEEMAQWEEENPDEDDEENIDIELNKGIDSINE